MMTPIATTLQKALDELRELPKDRQATLDARFEDMIARVKIDAKLAASEKRGGETPADEFFVQLRARFGD